MKKDIEIPIVKDVHVAIVREWNEEFLDKEWNAYIINNKTTNIDLVLIVSKGHDGDRKTSTIRHGIGLIKAKTYKKIEIVQENVLQLNNEFYVTFFADDKLFEKKYIFKKNTISENNLIPIPLLDKEGIFAE